MMPTKGDFRKAGSQKSRAAKSRRDASNSKDTCNSRCKDDFSTCRPFRIPKSNEKCLIREKMKENQ
jgi:hypothetical protein